MTKLDEMLKAARERQEADYLCGVIDAYCDNQECTAREISIKIKACADEDPTTVRCPLCGREPIINSVQTFLERERVMDQKARVRVNIQRYAKRAGGKFVAIPMSVAFDDSLDGEKVE